MTTTHEPALLRVELSQRPEVPNPVHPYAEWAAEHFVWPFFAGIVFLVLRSHVVGLLMEIKSRVQKGGKLSVGPEGITIEDVAQGRQEVKAAVADIESASKGLGQPTPSSADQRLMELGAKYCGKLDSNRAIRTQEKANLAQQMGALVVLAKLDRGKLLSPTDESKLAALASASILEPQSNDVALLLAASAYATTLHVRYTIAVAFARLLDERKVSKEFLERVESVLLMLRRNADDSLRKRVDKTLALLAVPT